MRLGLMAWLRDRGCTPAPCRLCQSVAWLIALTLLVTCLLAAIPARAHAETPGTAPVALVPADGNARGVQLRAQAVDITIRQDADGIWADTSLWMRLHNPGQTAAAVPVALTGPQAGPIDLPSDLALTVGRASLTLQPLPAPDGELVLGPTEPITVPLRGSVMVRLRYRQALPAAGDVATSRYPLTATTRWPGTPESLRVTIRFAEPVSPEQILAYESLPKHLDPDAATWHWEYKKAAQDVAIAFVSNAWWAALTTGRAAATAAEAGPIQHLALARRYRALAGLPIPPLAVATDLFERYYPLAVAELKTVLRTAAPADPAVAVARVELADLYRLRSERAETETAQAFLLLAAGELEAAAESSDPAVAAAAAELYGQLAASASARGDAVLAGQHRMRQAALQATGMTANDDALAQAAALAQAIRAVEAGDLAVARALIAEAFGPLAVTLPDAPPPLIGHARATVASTPDRRVITLRLGPAGDAAGLAPLLAEVAAAVGPFAQVEAGADSLTITLAGTPAQWREVQTRLEASLPATPELALLASILQPAALSWESTAETFRFTERYVELVSLTPAVAAWEAQAARIEQLARTRAGAADGLPAWLDAAPREQLAGVQRALWAADAAAWRALTQGSGATYQVILGLRGEERQWAVDAGAARQLTAEAVAWREDRLAWAAGGAVLLLILLALGVWRLV